MSSPDFAAWKTFGLSRIGAAHSGTVLPCQDTCGHGTTEDGLWAWIVAADGHGSSRHFRSDRGSRFAVDVMVQQFASMRAAGADAQAVADFVRFDLARKIEFAWTQMVAEDAEAQPPQDALEELPYDAYLNELASHPFSRQTPESVRSVAAKWAADPRAESLPNWLKAAYGSTLLGILIGPEQVHWLQVGDGALLVLGPDGTRLLCDPPEEAFANATPSLSSANAADLAIAGSAPIQAHATDTAFAITTDGIINSYDKEIYLSFIEGVVERFSDPNLTTILAGWLDKITQEGSGDDVTLTIASRLPPTPSDDHEGQAKAC